MHPEAAMVYGDALLINAEGKTIGKFPAAQTDYRKLRRGYVHIPQQASFFRAEFWRQVGPLDVSFYFAMDYDLWVRLAALAPLVYVPQLWAAFRLHGSETAALILEPVNYDSGCVLPKPGFLELCRKLCTQYGSVLF